MPSNILATANTAANSADVVVTASTPLTVCLKGVDGLKAAISIKLKDDAGNYTEVGSLAPATPALCITAPGTYRFSREAGNKCGVFSA
ncbi:hypothetical protein [Agrobacterium cavarae]|uniref:hypothetical protein n=1 Tax=Agrobacterium cavarae TaxID=2528239 RepID=UPI003FD538A8